MTGSPGSPFPIPIPSAPSLSRLVAATFSEDFRHLKKTKTSILFFHVSTKRRKQLKQLLSMQRASWLRYGHLDSLRCRPIRHASTRSFERPLARPKKSSALPPAKTSAHNVTRDSDFNHEFREQMRKLQSGLENEKKSKRFFTPAKKPSRWDVISKYTPTSFRILFTPGKILIYSLVGFISYKLYNWQTNPARTPILNPRFFYPFIIESKEPVSSTSAVISSQNYPLGQDARLINAAWKTGVWSVQVMQPDLQIVRSYTPLPPTGDMPPELIRLFVREEPKGEVSRMLHRNPIGSFIHLRGPYPEFEVPDGVKEVLFLAGGTGIAPALQVAHCLYKARGLTGEELPKMKILWANRRREDSRNLSESEELQQWRANLWSRIRGAVTTREGVKKRGVELQEEGKLPEVDQTRLVDEVEHLSADFGGKISVEYFVDEEETFITEAVLRSHLLPTKGQRAGSQSSDGSMIDPQTAKEGKKLVILAGPDGFIDHYAGPKIWEGSRERPGPLGGVLKRINPPGWHIWTL